MSARPRGKQYSVICMLYYVLVLAVVQCSFYFYKFHSSFSLHFNCYIPVLAQLKLWI